ncbi:(2Fe-2S) ferredoxin [Desulfonispora thiosulfatigenes DSM 11270]|uniref:(2Fe-2S) ferredoxin n=1 Tax=Desulfonispora thiosulfatigenes DSM 11270 TaxID=656914 RepID=A0A1W1V4I9_DESTI|nr:(2Fe-2S) ferredoxin domain-containing protein [Desulfonispora thiosulfatigenes]SMB87924.1 (2Fe-2S) ferredoxin [Desulfonispora thiosulfatigenes DSM 11270]
MSSKKMSIKVCDIPSCHNVPNNTLRIAIKEAIKEYNLEDKLEYVKNGCTGHCTPFVFIEDGDDRYLYADLTPEKVKRIIKEHVLEGKPVAELGGKF